MATNQCPRCSALNQPGVRYCVTCGNTLPAAKPAPKPDATLMEPPRMEPARAAAPGALTPVAVYQVDPATGGAAPRAAAAAAPSPPAAAPPAAAAAKPDGTRVCPKCRGTSDDQAHFCRFCGAALGAPGATPAAEPPKPDLRASPPSPAPVPVGQPAPSAAPPAVAPARPALPTPSPMAAVPAAVPARSAAATTPDVGRNLAEPAGRIVVITKEGGEGASYPLFDQLDVGRVEGDVVLSDDFYLSPRHARILRKATGGAGEGAKGSAFVLVDLASTNGVYLRINMSGPREVPLEDQDLFLVGQQVLKFEVVRHADEGLAPATQHGTLLFGTPATARYARISQRSVEGVARDVYHVQKAETVLGRESGDIVFTDDPFLSRRHAAVRFDHAARRFMLADLGSSNGTFIQIRGEVTIRSGDQFRIGQQLFRIDLNAAP